MDAVRRQYLYFILLQGIPVGAMVWLAGCLQAVVSQGLDYDTRQARPTPGLTFESWEPNDSALFGVRLCLANIKGTRRDRFLEVGVEGLVLGAEEEGPVPENNGATAQE